MLGKLFTGKNSNELPAVPMGFQLEQERSLYLSGHYPARRSWRHLSHHVSRYPHDLRAHTQRILLAQETELHDQLEGSLLADTTKPYDAVLGQFGRIVQL